MSMVGGALIGEIVFFYITLVYPHLKAKSVRTRDSQLAAYGRFICAVLDCMCTHGLVYTCDASEHPLEHSVMLTTLGKCVTAKCRPKSGWLDHSRLRWHMPQEEQIDPDAYVVELPDPLTRLCMRLDSPPVTYTCDDHTSMKGLDMSTTAC